MNTAEYLMVCLIEECSEVQKEAAKILRFGESDCDPNDPEETPNIEKLATELDDLAAIVSMLKEKNIVPNHSPGIRLIAKAAKMAKVKKFMGRSESKGRLNLDGDQCTI